MLLKRSPGRTVLNPQDTITPQELGSGLRRLVTEAAWSSATGALTSGVILTAFALHLGASNFMIGLLAASPFLSQLFQAPGVVLVERMRARKRIAVLSSVVGRSMLGLLAALAFARGSPALIGVFAAQVVLCVMGAFGGCAWNAWLRDLVPEDQLGSVFSRRTVYSTVISLVAGMAAAFVLDLTPDSSSVRDVAFALLYLAGCVSGLISARIVAGLPEPRMPEARAERPDLVKTFTEPLRDENFRNLVVFLSSWQFAVNFATPFFTVFLVRQLDYGMSFVVALSVISQLANIAMLRIWGTLADRFTNKSALLVAAPAYIGLVVAMIGASQIGDRTWAAVYLVVLHILMGAAVAGVTLASTNVAMKLSPKGSATAYIATNAMLTSLFAGIAPIIGGTLADFFAARRLVFTAQWVSPQGNLLFEPLHLSQWDFYFVLAGLLGLYALHRLGFVREEGEIDRREMARQVVRHSREAVQNLSTVAGLRSITDLPVALIRDLRVRARFDRRTRHEEAQPAE
jgi:MFS family permease